ncbi:MAG: toxin [Deltaproteobacteria bacterium]|nr:toxin [Deltaproteobacteria bacterium]
MSFEEIVFHVDHGDVLDILEHPNHEEYGGQRVLVVKVGDYVYLAPFVEMVNEVVLKTIISSRKATKWNLRGE